MFQRGRDYVDFVSDWATVQLITTTQISLLHFDKVAILLTAHKDHMIQEKIRTDKDLRESLNRKNGVSNFLNSACGKYGIVLWRLFASIVVIDFGEADKVDVVAGILLTVKGENDILNEPFCHRYGRAIASKTLPTHVFNQLH